MVQKRVFAAVFVFAIAYYYKITHSQWIGGPTVYTPYGALKGIKSISRGGKEFYEFLGIPYAKAPLGDLRFEVRYLNE